MAQSFLQTVQGRKQLVATQASQRAFEAMRQTACLVPFFFGDAPKQSRCLLVQLLMCFIHESNEFIGIHERFQFSEDRRIQCFHGEILTVSRTQVPTVNY